MPKIRPSMLVFHTEPDLHFVQMEQRSLKDSPLCCLNTERLLRDVRSKNPPEQVLVTAIQYTCLHHTLHMLGVGFQSLS